MKYDRNHRNEELQAWSELLLREDEPSTPELPDEPQEQPPKKKKKWKRVLLGIFLTLLGLVVAAVLAVLLYINHLLNQITPYDPANDATVSSSMAEQLVLEDPEAVTVPPEEEENLPQLEEITVPEEPVEEPGVNWDNVVNILLVGQDRRPGQGRQRSDTMIMVTINKSQKSITLTSFMRDAHVSIPGYKSNKLNAAYAFGGMSLLNQTLERNYGVRIDGDIEVDFNSFRKIIDLLGGVDISLTEKEATYLNNGLGLNGTSRELHVGKQRLDGELALCYARLREIDSDYRRAERQRTVLSSLIQRYQGLPVTEMLSLLEEILPIVVTNMSKGDIVDYVMDLAPMVSGAQLNTLRIPADGTFKQGIVRARPGLAAWFQYDIDFDANKGILYELFRENESE